MAALVAAVLLAAALPAALAVSVWVTASTGGSPLATLATGSVTLGLGMLCTAVAALAFDRSVLHALQPGAPWRGSVVGASLAALALGLLLVAPASRSVLGTLALFLQPVVVTALVLRRHLAMAASTLLLAALLVGRGSSAALAPWAAGGHGPALLAAWTASALALMLLAHAATVDWRSRSQRWEWALDGSARAGSPADWLASVHAEDRPALAAAIASLGTGEAGRRQLELRLPQGDGWRWMETTLMVIERSGGGEPVRLLATLADVQERREALEGQRMSVSLFQHLHEGLLITDAELRALDANPWRAAAAQWRTVHAADHHLHGARPGA